ncbi:hypothetical protein HP398_03610 [Brevibacillus sp. HB1.4B]|uniref:hypothetical protein n=1 Tax=Brevibacillus sp. HB1.4B TaxID=2738845 RepID=UPI00036C89D0|nr:hypothetical protein [Brevibacillus sp. HB1.4B]ATF13443.1 hypothetical protein A616_16090 [Brevibacillus brevis X23]NRS15519.1 hypothetical protein [Brevibacillus sp. HB1.4B]
MKKALPYLIQSLITDRVGTLTNTFFINFLDREYNLKMLKSGFRMKRFMINETLDDPKKT